MVTKASLKEELRALVAADLEAAERAQHAAHEGATHEDARPENDKDTRALEQSYLARGQARRVEELRADLALVDAMVPRAFDSGAKISLGALVRVDEAGASSVVWIAPARGGTELASGAVKVVTPSSPLGRALLGKVSGDDCEVQLASRLRALSIEAVE